MKLSEAINLGRSIIRHGDGSFTLDDCAGCACGMALAAIGKKTAGQWDLESEWPWANFEVWADISAKYRKVVKGQMTLDQLIHYVRTIEPAEQPESPSEVTSSQKESVGAV